MTEEVNLHDTTDAVVWAAEFVKRFGGDEELMIGWFANAIMAGHDAATKSTAARCVEICERDSSFTNPLSTIRDIKKEFDLE